jgi:hypothetical protein
LARDYWGHAGVVMVLAMIHHSLRPQVINNPANSLNLSEHQLNLSLSTPHDSNPSTAEANANARTKTPNSTDKLPTSRMDSTTPSSPFKRLLEADSPPARPSSIKTDIFDERVLSDQATILSNLETPSFTSTATSAKSHLGKPPAQDPKLQWVQAQDHLRLHGDSSLLTNTQESWHAEAGKDLTQVIDEVIAPLTNQIGIHSDSEVGDKTDDFIKAINAKAPSSFLTPQPSSRPIPKPSYQPLHHPPGNHLRQHPNPENRRKHHPATSLRRRRMPCPTIKIG